MSAKRSGVGRELRVFLLIGGLGLIILYVYFLYIFSPLSREAADVARQVRAARERMRTLEASTANEAALKEQYRQVEETVRAFRKTLPVEAQLPSTLELLSSLASKTNVKIQTIFPQRAGSPLQQAKEQNGKAQDPVVYKDILIQIEALAGYHELGTFLSLVETGERPMQVASLRISGNPKEPRRHQINLLLRSYFSIGDETASDQQVFAQGS